MPVTLTITPVDVLAATYLFKVETTDGQSLTVGPADARALEVELEAVLSDLRKSLVVGERVESDRRAKVAASHLDVPSLGGGPLPPEST